MCKEDARVSNSKMQYGILLVVQKEILELPASSVAEMKIFLTAAVQPWNKWQHDEGGLLLLGRSHGGLACRFMERPGSLYNRRPYGNVG